MCRGLDNASQLLVENTNYEKLNCYQEKVWQKFISFWFLTEPNSIKTGYITLLSFTVWKCCMCILMWSVYFLSLLSYKLCVCVFEWMNECLTTPQHENQIGYWVSEKGKCMKWLCVCVWTQFLRYEHMYQKFEIQIILSLYCTHWAISRSSQCSTTGVTKAVVCVILSVGWCI